MKIAAAQTSHPLPAPQPPPAASPEHDWLHELTSGELLSLGIHLSPSGLASAVSATRGVGKSLAGAWKGLRGQLDKLFHLPIVDGHVSPQDQQKVTSVLMGVAQGLGYTAAGVSGLAGIVKLTDKKSGTARRLEGLMDMATAGIIATTVAGLSVAPLVLAPVAGALGAVRGSINCVRGFRSGDGRLETQGMLDGARSTGTVCSRLGQISGILSTAGMILGAAAGVVQMARGFIDLDRGLRADNKSKQLEGLTDMATSVGLVLAATGVGTIPGIAITALSVGTKILYHVSKRVHRKVDSGLERMEPGLKKGVGAVKKVGRPVLKVARAVIAKVTGWHHGDQPPKVAKARAAARPPSV